MTDEAGGKSENPQMFRQQRALARARLRSTRPGRMAVSAHRKLVRPRFGDDTSRPSGSRANEGDGRIRAVADEESRRGVELERVGDRAGALAAYRAAITADPARALSHYRLARALEKEKRWAGAVAAYRTALSLRPDEHPEWLFRLGRALERSGEWQAARFAYRRASTRLAALPDGQRPKVPQLELSKQIDLALISKPAYAYCLYKGARLAAALDIERITAIEFGVAGGNGLVAMEKHAAMIREITGVAVDVLGFDTGEGLFEPLDHRDLPYFFNKGSYKMDVAALKRRLQGAELVLGDAPQTLREVLAAREIAPIGTISFDMDYYSATHGVLSLMGASAPATRFLPRVPLYFDDVVGKKGQDYNEFTGELLAIDEFNAANDEVKVTEDRYFRALPLNFDWHHSIYTMHRFNHPAYATYVREQENVHLTLR